MSSSLIEHLYFVVFWLANLYATQLFFCDFTNYHFYLVYNSCFCTSIVQLPLANWSAIFCCIVYFCIESSYVARI